MLIVVTIPSPVFRWHGACKNSQNFTVYSSVQLTEQGVGEGIGGTHPRAWQENETGWVLRRPVLSSWLGSYLHPWPRVRWRIGLLRASVWSSIKWKGWMLRTTSPGHDILVWETNCINQSGHAPVILIIWKSQAEGSDRWKNWINASGIIVLTVSWSVKWVF